MSIINPEKVVFPKLERPVGMPKPSVVKTPDVTEGIGTGSEGNGGISGVGSSEEITSFADRVKDLMSDVNQTQETAQQASDDFASGKTDDIHGTMVAMAKADVSLRLVGSLRNKAIEAYREIMRMGA